ncbi:anthrone oxygenase family protein [Streptomyces anulatus]|uniref:anthrone oxygenase family protein n=1 Tax=Streptomyces anulatus TaxID=1892 RepID=UPI0037249CDD
MELARILSLIIAAGSTGLVAGIVLAYMNSVMPGLARSDDRTFIDACQRLNTAIHNPLFMAVSNLALVGIVVCAALHLPSGHREPLPWVLAALVLYCVTLAVTLGVNVPLNNALIGAGHPDQLPDKARVRQAFETRWNRMNALRTATTTAAFGCLLAALAASA